MSNFLPVVKLEFINDKQVPAVTSQQLAEAFGKQHAHVMRDIRENTACFAATFRHHRYDGRHLQCGRYRR